MYKVSCHNIHGDTLYGFQNNVVIFCANSRMFYAMIKGLVRDLIKIADNSQYPNMWII